MLTNLRGIRTAPFAALSSLKESTQILLEPRGLFGGIFDDLSLRWPPAPMEIRPSCGWINRAQQECLLKRLLRNVNVPRALISPLDGWQCIEGLRSKTLTAVQMPTLSLWNLNRLSVNILTATGYQGVITFTWTDRNFHNPNRTIQIQDNGGDPDVLMSSIREVVVLSVKTNSTGLKFGKNKARPWLITFFNWTCLYLTWDPGEHLDFHHCPEFLCFCLDY